MNANITQETIDLAKTALGNPTQIADGIAKAYTTGTGLNFYDLQAPALNLYPVLTPLRNRIPRVKGGGDTATRWRAVTAINVGNMNGGVSEGNRGGVQAINVQPYTAAYAGLGLEDSVTFEGQYAAENFENVRATGGVRLLQATMIMEEGVLLGGNNSMALGTTPTPTLAAATTGGTIPASTAVSVICVALTNDGLRFSSVASGLPTNPNRTNADGTTDQVGTGCAKQSAAAAVTTGAGTGTNSVQATVSVVTGAFGYAWYVGAAGSERLAAITTLNSVVIGSLPGAGQLASALPAQDYSVSPLYFDGIMTQILKPGSNSYVKFLPTGTAGQGTPLTSDGAGGINEIDDAFQSFWDNYRLSPQKMLMSGTTLRAVNKLIIANGGAPLIRMNLDGNGGGSIAAGVVIRSYLNKITNTEVDIEVHPNMPDGAIMFESTSIPYPIANVQNILQVKCRQDYYQIEWPLRTRKYEFGVYTDEVLQCYFPPAYGLILNIAVK